MAPTGMIRSAPCSPLHFRALALLAALFVASMNEGRSQPLVTISDEVACPDCAIDFTQVAVLASPADASFAFLPPMSVARSLGGSFFVGTLIGDPSVAVYGPDGRLLGSVGGVGQGPGEFAGYPREMILRASSDSETVSAFHGPVHYVLGPTTTGVIRQNRVRVHPSDAALIGESFIVQATVDAPGGGTPLQELAQDGTVVRGFGVDSERPLTRRSSHFDRVRRLARGNGGRSLWSAYINRFEAVRYGLDGSEELRVRREAEWFPSYEDEIPGELFIVPQRPRIEGVMEDDRGFLWVVISHGAENMKPFSTTTPAELRAGAEVSLGRGDINLNPYVSTTLEVLDVNRGVVLARTTVENTLLRFVSDASGEVTLFAIAELQSGELEARVLRAGLSG